ncbi:ATPase, partial [bacterium]|nr:ATPase [bacterium]
VTVASSFNSMAIGSGINSILGGFIAACVLFLGHGLNIMLGLMSVIVHGIRLNMLEFSGHLSMQWAGKEYSPFKE